MLAVLARVNELVFSELFLSKKSLFLLFEDYQISLTILYRAFALQKSIFFNLEN